jgi:hypothetical protein
MDCFQKKAEEILSHFYADFSNPKVAMKIHLPLLKVYMHFIRMQGDAVNLYEATQNALPYFMQILLQDSDSFGMGDMFPIPVREEVIRQIAAGTEEGIDWHVKMLILEVEPYIEDIHDYYALLQDTPYECFSIQENREWLSNWMDEHF